MKAITSCLVSLVILAASAKARAQTPCLDDLECPNGQSCQRERCLPTAPAPAPTTVPAPYVYAPPPPPVAASPGWAGGAGIFGLVASGVVLGLAGASEGTKDSMLTSLPLGVTATVILAASVPIVAAGGISARRDGLAHGIRALRVLAWLTYGLSLAEASGLIALGSLQVTPPDGMIISTGLLGVSSLAMMSADALVSRKQAAERSLTRTRAPSAVQLMPTLTGNGVGLVGRF